MDIWYFYKYGSTFGEKASYIYISKLSTCITLDRKIDRYIQIGFTITQKLKT